MSAYSKITRIQDIELSSNWIEVELSQAGTLGVEVLYKADVLKDVELLKVKGPINSADWSTIKQMTNLLAIDLSEATFTSVPSNAFNGLSRLSSVNLPESVTSIGSYAFCGTQLLNIDIPDAVTTIGDGAFSGIRVRSVNFGENSKLQSIGYQAFYNCTNLREFIMPNTVTVLNAYDNDTINQKAQTFYGCTSLRKLHFSDALTAINQQVCYQCTKLAEVHLPQHLKTIRYQAFYQTDSLVKVSFPESLKSIGSYAFYGCSVDSLKLPLELSSLGSYAFSNCVNLKYIELPSYISSYNYNFYQCYAVKTVVCRSATPPSVSNDPFYGRTKSYITLKVPPFAVVNYKLHTYWYQFGSIEEGDDIDYWKITGALSLTNNRRMNGTPDVDLYYGGRMTVGGNAPMKAKSFNIYVNETNPGRLLNTCEAMTAESVSSHFQASAETWYFITPLHDVDLTQLSVSDGASYVFRYYDSSSRATDGIGEALPTLNDLAEIDVELKDGKLIVR